MLLCVERNRFLSLTLAALTLSIAAVGAVNFDTREGPESSLSLPLSLTFQAKELQPLPHTVHITFYLPNSVPLQKKIALL